MKRRWAYFVAAALGAPLIGLPVLALAVGIGISGPRWEGPPTDHFDGTSFHNRLPTELPSFGRAVRMAREPSGPAWERREVAPHEPPPTWVDGGRLRATFVNHATVLLQHDGMNVLTDPIWSERCSPFSFAGPARHHPPGLDWSELPPIDLVLISHNHYDHLDLPTLAQLAARDAPTLVVPLGNGPLVADLGFERVVELDWGQTVAIDPLRVTGMEVRHFSSRGLLDRQSTLWMGFVVEGPSGRWVFAGDTGYGPHYRDVAASGPFRLALLPIGAYAPRWFMSPIHQDPAEAVQAHLDLQAAASLGVHHGTFRLTREGQDDPARELSAALAAAGLSPEVFRVLDPGEGWEVPPLPEAGG